MSSFTRPLLFLIVLCLILGEGIAQKASTTLPTFDPSRIDIVRDSFGVPHIFAPTDAEAAYGLAWATAEDDIENSQFMLLAMRGMLGRHLGEEGAKIDYAVQLLQVVEHVNQHYEKEVPEDFKRVLEGYAAGANAYFMKHPDKLYFKKMLPVTPQDLVCGYMLGMALMGGVEGTVKSIINGSIVNKVPHKEEGRGSGSNGFAFGPAKTKDGSSYLAVNAHQPLEGLLSWYEAHVHSDEGWNIVGALFHGATTIFLGSNEHLGWTHTTGQLDEIDVFKLEMHPKKKKWYRFDGGWYKLKQRTARLRVKIGKRGIIRIPVPKRYWTSKYGPTLVTKHGTYAIRMPALLKLQTAEQWYRMNKASNFEEFQAALRLQGLSRQNITYADDQGNIYFLSNGLVPDRNRNFDWKMVVPGDTSATLWTDYMPIDSLSFFHNPQCGWVFNTNNAGFEATAKDENHKIEEFAKHIGYKNEYNNRSLRFYELMEEKYKGKKIDYQDFKEIKFDHTYPERVTYRGRMWVDELFTLNPDDHPEIADAIRRIKNFDGTADTLDRNYSIFLYTTYMILKHGHEQGEAERNPEKRPAFFVNMITKAQDHMMKHFGTIDIPLGKVQILKRGDKEYGMSGGPDFIRDARGTFMDDGRVKVRVGDSYVQLTQFTKDGTIIESISPFGASSFPESPHHNDQMGKFVNHELKKMPLDKESVYKMAERVYHPE